MPKSPERQNLNEGLEYPTVEEAGFDGLVSGENPDLSSKKTDDQEKKRDAEDIDIEKLMETANPPPPLSDKYRQLLEKVLAEVPKDDEFKYREIAIGTEEMYYLKEVLEEYHDVLDRPEDIPSKEKKVYSTFGNEEIYVDVDNKEHYKIKAVEQWKRLRELLFSIGDVPLRMTPDQWDEDLGQLIEPYFRDCGGHFDAFFDLIIQRPDGVFAVPTGAINAEIILKAMMDGLKYEIEKQGWEGIKIPYFTYPHTIALTRDGGSRLTRKEQIAITEPSILHIYNQREDSNKIKIVVFDDCTNTGGSRTRVEKLVRETYEKLQDGGQIPQSCKLDLNYISTVYPGLSEAYRFGKFDEDSNDRRPVSISDGMPEYRREQLAFKLANLFGFFVGRLYGNIIVPMEKPKNKIGTRYGLSHKGLLQGIKGTLERKY